MIVENDEDLKSLVKNFNQYQKDISEIAYNNGKPLRALELHKLVYYQIPTDLGSQMKCSAIRTVSASYASAKSNGKPADHAFTFKRASALFQHNKDFSFTSNGLLSIATSNGRKKLKFTIPEYFKNDFNNAKSKDSLTVTATGKVHLCITLEVPDPVGKTVIGIDLGVNTALVASKDENTVLVISGKKLQTANKKTRKLRKRLVKKLAVRKAEKKSTKSVSRLLKRLGLKQRNRTKTFCREAAAKLCKWVPPNSVLVFEDLCGIRESLQKKPGRKRKGTIRKLNEWFFRGMITASADKAVRTGHAIDFTNPPFTSQTCCKCGLLGKRFGAKFSCVCGNVMHSDVNASHNIRLNFAVLRSSGLLSVSP